jgi:hypothetical protein
LRERLDADSRVINMGRMGRLEGLAPGRYELLVKVDDHLSGASLRKGTRFTIR